MKTPCLGELFCHIAHHAWEYQDELGMSDADVQKIMELKIKTKKEHLKNEAQVECLSLDIMAGIWAPKPDAAAIKKLIDSKFELKRGGMKNMVDAFLALKGIFSKDQMKKLKEICKRQQCGNETKKEVPTCRS
jgi:hypothetical protein